MKVLRRGRSSEGRIWYLGRAARSGGGAGTAECLYGARVVHGNIQGGAEEGDTALLSRLSARTGLVAACAGLWCHCGWVQTAELARRDSAGGGQGGGVARSGRCRIGTSGAGEEDDRGGGAVVMGLRRGRLGQG